MNSLENQIFGENRRGRRRCRNLASSADHPLSGTVGSGRVSDSFVFSSACWGQRLMANVVVVGSQWGDEGKGKIVDWLSEQADIVVRFQGGHNAGHTLVIDGTTYKLSLLPSGVVRPGKLSVIGNGVVLDPRALLNEIATLQQAGRHRDAGQSAHRREHAADPAAAPGARRRAREGVGQRRHRHHRPRHRPGLRGQGRPPRHPSDGPRRPADAQRQDRPPAGASQRAPPRARHERDRAARALR